VPNGQRSAVVAYRRRVTAPHAEADATDAQLLERFVARRDQAASEALLRRHAPLGTRSCPGLQVRAFPLKLKRWRLKM
jgi:hypothetical protein